jgi:hypothetical protein
VKDKKEGQAVYVWTNGDRYEVRCSQMTCHCILKWSVNNKKCSHRNRRTALGAI